MNYRRPLSVIRVPRVNSCRHPSLRYRKRPVPGNIFTLHILLFPLVSVCRAFYVMIKLSLGKTLNRILLVPKLSVCMS